MRFKSYDHFHLLTTDGRMDGRTHTHSGCSAGPRVVQFVAFRVTGYIIEPVHEISNNVASDQPAHTRRLIRVFASRLSIL